MKFPFKFNRVETFAEEGKISIRNVDDISGEFLRVNYDAENFGEILRNLKIAYKAAKRQIRQQKKLEKSVKKDSEANQD